MKTNEKQISYGYYSKLLKKPFDTVAELETAEAEYNKAHAAELKKIEERKERAKEVEDAAKRLDEARRTANRLVGDAEREYIRLRNNFVRDFGSYHSTVTKVVDVNDFFKSLDEIIDAGFYGLFR